jgi:phosphopantothenoylcysteine decarboxylase
LLEDRATGLLPGEWSLDEAAFAFAAHAPGIVLVPPQAKRLACGDVGIGAMAEVIQIAEVVRHWTEPIDRSGDP